MVREYKNPVHLPDPAGIYAALLFEPHSLIAGTTGSGKSTVLHSVLYAGHLLSPAQNKFMYIDLKGGVELTPWAKLPHSLGIALDPTEAARMLDKAMAIMDERYKFLRHMGLSEYDGYRLYVVIDEIADLMATGGKAIEDRIARLVRMGRAAGVHVIACTQNPSRGKGGGLPAAVVQNMTARLALRCMSAIESRQILTTGGAEKLPRHGKGLLLLDGEIMGVDIPLQPRAEIDAVRRYWRTHKGKLRLFKR